MLNCIKIKSCQKVKTNETLITGKRIINTHGTDPLNVRLAAKIRFGRSKFRTLHALYNLPSKKKENLLFKLANSLIIFHTITSLWVVFDHYCWSKFVASGTINELDFYHLQMHFQKSSQSQLLRGHLADSYRLCWQAFFPFFPYPSSPCLLLLHVPLGYNKFKKNACFASYG